MKYSLTLISVASLLGVTCAQAEDVLPPLFTYDRYSKMVDHSPFAVATAVAAPQATPDFAKDLFVANAADRKSTRLNSSHSQNSYAVFCLKKKKNNLIITSQADNVYTDTHTFESSTSE